MPLNLDVLGYFAADIICSEKRIVFRDRGKTVNFEEQLISKDKYCYMVTRQMFLCFLVFKFFRNVRVFKNLEISLGYSKVLAKEYSIT